MSNARRSIAPAFAALLLVLIAVVAATLAYIWVSGYLASTTRGASAPELQELVKIEGVRVEEGAAVVTVRNIGGVKTRLKAVYVVRDGVAAASATNLDLVLEPGQSADLTITASLPPGSYHVKVVTASGVEAAAPLRMHGFYLYARSAIFYTPFDSLPPGWSNIGGSWTTVNGGVEGKALQGTDAPGGPGGASVYYWTTSVADRSSLQAVLQVKAASVDRVYRGIVLLEGTTSRSSLYEMYVRPVVVYGDNKIYLTISWYNGTRDWWTTLARKIVPFAPDWYTLYVSWNRRGAVNEILLVLYDSRGNELDSITTSGSQLTVKYFGLVVDAGAAIFDNLVLSDRDPRYVVVSGLQSGWVVELWDSGGGLVASAPADGSGVARLFVVTKPIVANAKITVKDAAGSVVVEKNFTVVVGGDEYVFGL